MSDPSTAKTPSTAILAQGHFLLKNHFAFTGGQVFFVFVLFCDATWMDSCTRWLVAPFSQGSPSAIRGVATRPAVSAAWATATVDTWEGSGQSAQSRSCIGSIGSRRCCGEDGSVGACQGGEETATVISASPLEPRRSSGTCPMQGETFRGSVEWEICRVPRSSSCRTH